MTNNKYKILLVEDDGSIRSIMTTMLESAGYQVIPADTCGLAFSNRSRYVRTNRVGDGNYSHELQVVG